MSPTLRALTAGQRGRPPASPSRAGIRPPTASPAHRAPTASGRSSATTTASSRCPAARRWYGPGPARRTASTRRTSRCTSAASARNAMPSRRDFLVSVAQAGVALSALRLPKHSALFASGAPAPDSRLLDVPIGLDWRMLGPFRGGRCDAASGVPGRPDEFYFGHVNGGVWKTTDAGRTWLPVFDDQPVASIGALAVAPSAPDVIYAGTGESTLRDSVGFGNGVYKSTDAGRTWTHLGLADTQHIGKIAVDSRNPEVVF